MLINLKQNNFNIEVDLPLSKSESNRALMIAFYLKSQRLKDLESQTCRWESPISSAPETPLPMP